MNSKSLPLSSKRVGWDSNFSRRRWGENVGFFVCPSRLWTVNAVLTISPWRCLNLETVLISSNRERSVVVHSIQFCLTAAGWRHHRMLKLKIRWLEFAGLENRRTIKKRGGICRLENGGRSRRGRPSFSTPANSTHATSSVIFQSCKFQSCKFSYPSNLGFSLLYGDTPSVEVILGWRSCPSWLRHNDDDDDDDDAERYNEPIKMKFDMEQCTVGLLSFVLSNLALISDEMGTLPPKF